MFSTISGISKKNVILFVSLSTLILVIVLSISITASKNSAKTFDLTTHSKFKLSFKQSEAPQPHHDNTSNKAESTVYNQSKSLPLKQQPTRFQQNVTDNKIGHGHSNGMSSSIKIISFHPFL